MNENEITVKTQVSTSAEHLAHLLGRCADPETIFDLLEEDPRDTETIIRGNAREYISDVGAKVTINSLEYAGADSMNIVHSVAHFHATLSGSLKELMKVVGYGKMFARIDR